MSFSNITGCYYQKETNEYPSRLSPQQLLALHVAANYKLRWCSMGWWADGYVWLDSVGVHHHSTIQSLFKSGLIEGNALGEYLGSGALDGRSKRRAALWASAKGRKLLERIAEETGLAFDKENYTLVEPRAEQTDRVIVDRFAGDREAALAYDRVAVLFFGEDAETNFPPEESNHVVLPEDIMRQINALKAGRSPH